MKKKIFIGAALSSVLLVVVLVAVLVTSVALYLGGFFSEEWQAYNQAVAPLKDAGTVTFDVKQTTTTRLDDEDMVLKVEQVLTYASQDTNAPFVHLKEKFPGVSANGTYEEYFTGKTLYVNQRFQGELTKSAAKKRYAPVSLLTPRRYKEITSEVEDGITVIRFTSPWCGERWAIPSGTTLVTASGSASLDADGNLLQMQYTVTYRQGNSEVTVETVSKPWKEAVPVSLPTDTDSYQALTYIDAPRVIAYGNARLKGLSSAEAAVAEYILQMNGDTISSSGNSVKSTTLSLCQENGKLRYELFGTSVSDNYALQQEISYKNGMYGKYTISTLDPNGTRNFFAYTDDEARKKLCNSLYLQIVDASYWEDVIVSDLNGITFLEFTYTDKWGEDLHDSCCPNGNCTQDYEVTEMSGYVALDQTSGLVTASGYRNVWRHKNADSKTYITQNDMTLTAPTLGAYLTLLGKLPGEKEPEEKATPLFYRVTGKDGQELWLLGTIHVGDARTGYLPDEIYDALKNSDALALEMDQEKFQEAMEEDAEFAQKVNDLYFTSTNKPKDVLSSWDYSQALKLIKASGNYAINIDDTKIALWENLIGNFYLQLGHDLQPEKGVENRLTALAKKQNKPIWEVESGLFQMEMLFGWSVDLQEMLLTSTLETDWRQYCQQTSELYNLWCKGDEKSLRKAINRENIMFGLSDSEKERINALMEEYDKAMNTDRNKKMTEKAISYLESDKTVFFAVGLAHLLDDTDGLVDALRREGYTVEQVIYS